jgi:hypothetical protein
MKTGDIDLRAAMARLRAAGVPDANGMISVFADDVGALLAFAKDAEVRATAAREDHDAIDAYASAIVRAFQEIDGDFFLPSELRDAIEEMRDSGFDEWWEERHEKSRETFRRATAGRALKPTPPGVKWSTDQRQERGGMAMVRLLVNDVPTGLVFAKPEEIDDLVAHLNGERGFVAGEEREALRRELSAANVESTLEAAQRLRAELKAAHEATIVLRSAS